MRRRKRGAEDSDKPDELVVPVDPFNEAVVVAAVIVSREAANELLPVLSPDHFFARGHAKAWEVLREMHRRGLYYDPQTVLQMSGGEVDVAYLDGLARERPERPPNLSHHVGHLRWDKARVESARGPLAALQAAYRDVTSPPDKVRTFARQLLDALSGHGSDQYIQGAGEVARAHAKVLKDRRTGDACYGYGVPTLDVYADGPEAGNPRLVPGAAPGCSTLITGVSGAAKTSVTCRFILEMARMHRRVLVGAWEQGEGMTLELVAALSLGMYRGDVSRGRFDETDEQDILREMERLGEFIRFFRLPFGRARAERGGQNDRQIDLIAQVVADSRCDVFVADLMRRAMKETKPDDEEQFLYRLQDEGKRLAVHQIWLHQMRLKDVETRPDKRPTREGMKGSSAWVEVPDTILGLHRPALWKDVPDNRIEVIVLKQRYDRWPLAVELDWDPELVSLENGRSIDYVRPGEQDEMDSFLTMRGRGRGRG